MNTSLADVLGFLQGHNSWLFWAALAAITCGLSLLLTGVYLHVRRLWRQGLRHSRGPRPVPDQAPAVLQTAASAGYQPPGGLPAAPTGPVTSPPAKDFRSDERELTSGSLPVVLKRLRQATDGLEAVAGELLASDHARPESSLKHLAGDVEYVFKASRH